MKKNRKKSFLVLWCALLVTGVLIAGLGAFLKYTICKPLGIFQDENIITLPFVMLSSRGLEQSAGDLEQPKQDQNINRPAAKPNQPTIPATTAPQEVTTEPTTLPPETDPPTEPEPRFQVPVYREDESYFDDVLFIGDSRTCGLRDYNRLGEADYFCNVGMTVFSVWGETASDYTFSGATLSELLANRTYGKIYISLGINECGYPLDMLTEAFQKLVSRVREAQPDAIIVLSSVMTVGREKAASASYFSLENLELVNAAISSLADGETVFFLDVNEAVADEEGYLPDEMSSDGCHLYGIYYENWSRWLCESVAQLNE